MIADIVERKKPCFFVSPHLDDAVLSAGGLLAYLARKVPVTLATVFTEAGELPYTFSIKSYLRQCGYKDAFQLFSERRKEDERLCRLLGIRHVHLGFVDALWRRRGRPGILRELLGKYIPEALYRYPIYRLHMLSGRMHREDTELKQAVVLALRSAFKHVFDPVVFSCGAVGSHVDHILVREACLEVSETVIQWSDFPYNARAKNISDAIASIDFSSLGLASAFFGDKKRLIELYQTQVPAMFPGGVIPLGQERYRIARMASDTVLSAVSQTSSPAIASSSNRLV